MAVALLLGLGLHAAARADANVAALTRQLESPSDKTRLAAVLALAKLGDPAACKPLMTSLRDASPRVRAVAATALGRLEYAPALPALRALATDDRDSEVRKAASTATLKLASASRREDPRSPGAPAGPVDAEARRSAPALGRGLDHAAMLGEPHPDLYLLINSSADESPGTTDKATRQGHAEIIRRELLGQLRAERSVTTAVAEARRWALDARHIDLSVTKLELRRAAGGAAELVAELRIAISDDSGKMLSFLTGGAKVQVSAKFDARYLPALRREVLENAMRGMLNKLLAHLHDHST